MLLGDLSYEGLKRIFKRSGADDLGWDAFLAPHHCSKSAMYGRDEGESDDTLKQHILDDIEAAAREGAYIIASCGEIPQVDQAKANPPHRVAANHYQELVDSGCFLVTNDYGPEAIVFDVDPSGITLRSSSKAAKSQGRSLSEAAAAASGASSIGHTSAVGFG
jgi:hypothetical protein